MPLTDRERETSLKVCEMLSRLTADRWELQPGPTPDDLDPTGKTPDTLAQSDSRSTAGIEIKGLTGDDVINAYRASILSLERRLTPTFGGTYELVPAGPIDLPLTPAFMRELKGIIEKCATGMSPYSTIALPVPRGATLIMLSDSGPGFILCNSHNTGQFWSWVRERITGRFFLDDPALTNHDVLGEAERKDLADTIVDACDRMRLTGDGRVEITETWTLHRLPDGEPEGVRVLTASRARNLQELNRDAALAMVSKALEKFAVRRWGDLHIIALDKENGMIRERWVGEALAEFLAADLPECDLVVYVDDRAAVPVWTSSGEAGEVLRAPLRRGSSRA